MKKMIAVAAAALCGTVAFGEGSATLSTGIVGYTTRNAPKNSFRLAGIPFKSVEGSFCIQDIVPMTTEVENEDDDAFWVEAPQLQIQKPDSTDFDTYFYINNAIYTTDDWETTDVMAGWADDFGVLCIPEYYSEIEEETICLYSGLVTPGVGMWFVDPEKEGSLVPAGSVPDAEYTITCPKSFRLRALAHPVQTKINDASQIQFTGITPVSNEDDDAFWTSAPQLQVQRADGTTDFDTYFYIDNAIYTTDDWETTDVKTGWADDFGVLCIPEYYSEIEDETICLYPGIIPPGNGMWANGGPSAFTIKFKNPLAK